MSEEPRGIKADRKRGGRRFWVGVLTLSVGVVVLIAAGFFVSTTFIFRSDQEKSAQDEATEILVGIYDAEAAYFTEHGCFDADPKRIGFSPKHRPRYYSWAIVHAGCGGYIARAWGNLDDDDALDIWEITDYDRQKPMHVFSDEFDQGYTIDPESSENWRPTDGGFLFPAGRRD
ncbi:MAG: hypothetical protein JW885_02350 [Deltaproteobacteria bacterium]|nr:hypothetical protein [Candidatus Zymogenaceae bacterium]